MSNIPYNAVSAALTPLQQQTNEAIRARKAQLQKNLHHVEDIQELEEAGVDAIHDQDQREGQPQEEQPEERREDRVEIHALESAAEPAPRAEPMPGPGALTPPPPRLDISA